MTKITASEARAITNKSTDVLRFIDEEIYVAAYCGYGALVVKREFIPSFYELCDFLKRYYISVGFAGYVDTQNGWITIEWDSSKEAWWKQPPSEPRQILPVG